MTTLAWGGARLSFHPALLPQGRPGEICVIGPKGQKVSEGLEVGRAAGLRWPLSHTHCVCVRETLALWGLKVWQESLDPPVFLGPLG